MRCVWEHNGNDTLLYAVNFPGAYTRGEDLNTAINKMGTEIRAYLAWKGECMPAEWGVEIIQDDYELVQTIEGDADRLMVALLRDLYQGSVAAKEVIILKDMYELLEATIDHCRDAAKVVFQVALKYS